MTGPATVLVLAGHLAMLSAISFGGVPAVLPDVRALVVGGQGWLTDREFANFFAIAQAIPGPNMVLMMSFIGWKVAGLPGAFAGGLAIFGPSCTMAFAVHRVWDRFRDAAWQRVIRRGLAPVTIGLIVAGGFVMARAAAAGWSDLVVTGTAAALMLSGRVSPLWILLAAGAAGAVGIL